MQLLKNIVKAVISIGLLGYLIYEAEPSKIIQVYANVGKAGGYLYLLLAFLFAFLAIFIMAGRWQKLLEGYNHSVPVSRLTGFYLIGLFFNNFLPTSIGGDVVRIYKIIEETEDRTSGFASVIIERVLGIAATLSIAIVSLFFISHHFHSQKIFVISLVLLAGILLVFLVIAFNRSFHFFMNLFEKITFLKIGEKLNKLFDAIRFFKGQRGILISVFAYSVVSQGSMGIRDLGYVSLLAKIGVSNAEALSLSFMNLLIPMAISIWGAILFIGQKKNNRKDQFNVFETNV